MGDLKGKGKATAEPSKDNDASSSSSNPINNLLSNVASSATGLARCAFAAPSSNVLSNASSSGLLGNAKGQFSSYSAEGSSAYAESSRLANQASSSAGQAQASGAQPQGFRTAHEHVQASEAEFSSFLDGISSMEADMSALDLSGSTAFPAETALPTTYQPQPSHLVDDHPHPASRHIKPLSNEEFIRYSAHQPSHSLQPSLSQPESYPRTYSTVQDAQAHDGTDVLAILDTFTPQTLDYFEPQTIEQEVEDWHLTREQNDLAKKLANELHITPAVANLAQMVPRAFQEEEKAEYLPEEYAQDSFGQFGKVLPAAEAREKWVEQWNSVLNRYQDEVWGGMAPLVKEAKEEIKEIVEGSGGGHSKALARLGLVLGHISGFQQQVGTEKGTGRE